MFPLILAAALSVFWSEQPANPSAHAPVSAYVPERVYDTRRSGFTDLEAMLAELAKADVVVVGEEHDDPNTHHLESAILQGLSRRSVSLTVSLEMFERDAQRPLEAYLSRKIDEQAFLNQARPWPRYATDYRPLVELAMSNRWPVIAGNVPRKYAALVAKSGLAALDELPADERALVARDIRCPLDSYFERFSATMNAHPIPDAEKTTETDRRATHERYYVAQCIKDETMAESIASAFERPGVRPGTVVHFNGAFHSDFGGGVAERVRRRLPDRRIIVVSILPVKDIDAISPQGEDLKRAEFLVYTTRS
jgi:uncharacterized iron-regulated protein